MLGTDVTPSEPAGIGGGEDVTGVSPASGKGDKKSKTPALDHFCRDLTELARQGKLDPTIGRADEIERMVEILCRRKKNNPVLIGEPGVGKTAIVEGLAQIVPKVRSQRRCKVIAFWLLIWRPSSPVPSIAASLKSD